MSSSMRRQTPHARNQKNHRADQSKRHEQAIARLRRGRTVIVISHLARVSKIVRAMRREATIISDWRRVQKSKTPFITKDEANIINGRLELAAKRRFDMEMDSL